jgi:hypothetical protein
MSTDDGLIIHGNGYLHAPESAGWDVATFGPCVLVAPPATSAQPKVGKATLCDEAAN